MSARIPEGLGGIKDTLYWKRLSARLLSYCGNERMKLLYFLNLYVLYSID